MHADDRDTSSDTTVPHLVAGEIPVYLSEDESPRVVPAHRYGLWAYVDSTQLGLTRGERAKKKAAPGPRLFHIVHQPSGRTVTTVQGEVRADELARALAARCPTWCSSCSLGDTPDDGEEIRAMVMVVAEVAPTALLGSGLTAQRLAQHMKLAQACEDAAFDEDVADEGVAA